MQAEGIVAGFPCQAGSSHLRQQLRCCPVPLQGVSKAGLGLGREDSRTGLITEVYRLVDKCPRVPLDLVLH